MTVNGLKVSSEKIKPLIEETNFPAEPVQNATWNTVCAELRNTIGETNFRSWIQPIHLVHVENGIMELRVPTRFMRDWVRTHYTDQIRRIWTREAGILNRVEITVSAEMTKQQQPTATISLEIANDSVSVEESTPVSLSSQLDQRFTFENFMTGHSNELAFAAAKKIASTDTQTFNPLFIYGGVGRGKTHLMQATAAEITANNPDTKVVYMSAEKFMYTFVQALRKKDMMTFKSYFRDVDVLMIDDIQFICGKKSTQEEFFHTFNALFNMGKKIILTADRSPSDLQDIDPHLRSRLAGGLPVEIQPATPELRLNILQSKCQLMQRNVPVEVLSFLADNIATNIRELEGALNRLIAQAELLQQPITLQTAKTQLHDILRAHKQSLTIEDIQQKIAAYYGIKIADLLSAKRSRHLARPRQIAMYFSKQLTACSLPDIGRRFGGRDHTTIIHGVRNIEKLIKSDPQMEKDVAELSRLLVEQQ